MSRRGRPRARTRRYVGAIWEDGGHSCIAIAAAPDQHDQGRLVDFRECDEETISASIAAFEQLATAESGEIQWMVALRGASTIAEACLVPREVENAPAETKAIACLAGTAWGDPETAAQMQLALAYQIDRGTCVIAAAREGDVASVCERYRDVSTSVTCEAITLAELVRLTRPEVAFTDAQAVLGVLCTDRTASFVVMENEAPVIARQCDLTETIRSQSARRRSAQSGPGPIETTAEAWAADEFVPRWSSGPVDVDGTSWNAAFLGELRETLSLYNECGGHISDIGLVLVTGGASERFELRGSLPKALGFDIEVRELEASRVVTSNDVDVARRVAESEASIAGALALLAAGRRPDILTFAVDANKDLAHDRSTRASTVRTDFLRTAIAWLIVLALGPAIGAAIVGARCYSLSVSREALRQQIAVEERRAAELQAISREKADNEARYAHVAALLASIDTIRLRQQTPAALLADIQQLLPERAGLERVAFDGTWLTISGASEDATDADAFALNLQAASDRFADVSPATSADSYTRVPAPETGLGPEVRPLERFSIRARVIARKPGELSPRP